MLQIGFCVYRAVEGDTRLQPSYFLYNYDCGNSGPYINYREVFARYMCVQRHHLMADPLMGSHNV